MNRITTALIAFAGAALPLIAQTPKPVPGTIAPPVLPLLANYSYWPTQFVQFVGTELPYSMIELDVDATAGKRPLLYVTLTDRATGKRIHYAEDDGLVASAAAQGEEAHRAAIAYEGAETDNPGSTTTVRLTMADGKPLQWRFVQGSDISEQGSGMNPFPDAKIPVFAYRELGAVAAEGTALQIGDIVSAAAVWTEISHPPYFIGYRGAVTQSSHTLVFVPGSNTWKTASTPASLTSGASWELEGERGNHRTLRIDKVEGTHVTVTSTDRFQPRVHLRIEATHTEGGWSFERVQFIPDHDGEKHLLALQFSTSFTAVSQRTELTLMAGRKKVLAAGTLLREAQAPGAPASLSFTSPDWLKGKSMSEQVTDTPDGSMVSARPANGTKKRAPHS